MNNNNNENENNEEFLNGRENVGSEGEEKPENKSSESGAEEDEIDNEDEENEENEEDEEDDGDEDDEEDEEDEEEEIVAGTGAFQKKTEQTLEYQQSLLTPDIFEHPIFSLKEDEMLGPLGELIKSLLIPFPQEFNPREKLNMFVGLLFASMYERKPIKELKEEFSKLGFESKTICGGFISKEMISFRCLDCEILTNSMTLICTDCFDKSNHEGHRVLMIKGSGFCDCGDGDMMKPEAFCPDHK